MDQDKNKSGMDLPQNIKEAFDQMNAMRGECPASEKLLHFQERLLPSEEMIVVKRHIEDCGKCDLIISGLTQFDMGVQEQPKLSWVQRVFLNPVFAYILVLALVYPAYRGIFPKSTVSETVEPHETRPQIATAIDFDLGEGTLQRSSVSGQKETILQVPSEEKFFILNFFIPVRQDRNYEMQITDEKEDVISSGMIKSRDQFGNFSLVCPCELFPEGAYTLSLKERDKQKNQLVDEYLFRFKVKISSK